MIDKGKELFTAEQLNWIEDYVSLRINAASSYVLAQRDANYQALIRSLRRKA